MLDLGPGVLLAIGMLLGTVTIIVVWKFPEFLIAMLLVGQDFVQAPFRMFGMQIDRRTFAIAGSIFFGAIALLLLTRHLLRKSSGHRMVTREHWWIIGTIVIMGLFLVAGLSYTKTPLWGTKLVIDYVTFGVVPFMLCLVFIRDIKSAKRLLIWVFILVVAYMGLVTAHSLITQGKLLTTYQNLSRDTEAVTVLGVEVRGSQELQDRSTIMLAALFGWLAMTQRRWVKWGLLALVPLIIVYVMMSGARTGILVLGIFGFMIPVLLFRRNLAAMVGVGFAMIGLMAVSVFFLPEEATQRIMSPVFEGSTTAISAQSRLQAWRTCLDMIVSQPLVGYGTGGYAMKAFGADAEIHPHNMFLQMFAENGVFAFLTLCVFWGLVFYFPYRHLKMHHRGEAAFGLMVWVLLLMTNEFCKGMLHNAGIAHNQSKIILASGIVARLLMLVSQEEANASTLSAHLDLPAVVRVGQARGRAL